MVKFMWDMETRESDFKYDRFLIPIKVSCQGRNLLLPVSGFINLHKLLLDLDGPFADCVGSFTQADGPSWPLMERKRTH